MKRSNKISIADPGRIPEALVWATAKSYMKLKRNLVGGLRWIHPIATQIS